MRKPPKSVHWLSHHPAGFHFDQRAQYSILLDINKTHHEIAAVHMVVCVLKYRSILPYSMLDR